MTDLRIRSLDYQEGCIRHLIAMCPQAQEDVIAGAEQAIKTLEWMQKGELVLKELMRLRKEEPELFETLRRLIGMGARLSDIRETERMAEERGV